MIWLIFYDSPLYFKPLYTWLSLYINIFAIRESRDRDAFHFLYMWSKCLLTIFYGLQLYIYNSPMSLEFYTKRPQSVLLLALCSQISHLALSLWMMVFWKEVPKFKHCPFYASNCISTLHLFTHLKLNCFHYSVRLIVILIKQESFICVICFLWIAENDNDL